jgi:hypothetical protein
LQNYQRIFGFCIYLKRDNSVLALDLSAVRSSADKPIAMMSVDVKITHTKHIATKPINVCGITLLTIKPISDVITVM